MYICNSCSYVFDEPKRTEHLDIINGNSAMSGVDIEYSCPHCDSSDYEEAVKCRECEELFSSDNLTNGFCPDCILKLSTVENAMEFGEQNKASIEINGFLASVFDESEIEQCLRNCFLILPQFAQKKYAEEFCLEDNSSFSYFLEQLEAEK